MIKNDPNKILEKEKISKQLLSDVIKEALKEFDGAIDDLKEFPKDKSMIAIAEEIGKATIEILNEDIKRIKDELKDDVKVKQEKKVKKAQSKKVSEKIQHCMDELAQYRKEMREERNRKIASGEIKPPAKKRLTTKLKDRLKSIVGMMPKAIKEDKKKIDETEKATMEYISKLKKIWGMNTIKPIEAELKESFDKLEEKAEKKVEEKAA